MKPRPYTQAPCVCTIGVFDGVHLGHQALLEALVEDAIRRNCKPVVVTFDRDPDELFCPQRVHKLLTNAERLDQLKRIIPAVLDLSFTKELASQQWQEFLDGLLLCLPALEAIFVGVNFHCGAQAGGGIPEITSWGEKHNISVVAVPLYVHEGLAVSASRIRALLAAGDVKGAAELLTRPFALSGCVVAGAGRGHSLGFATANVKVDGSLAMMGPYVYAAYVQLDGKYYKAAVAIGDPPTYSPESQEFNPFIFEAHLIDYEGSLYGQQLKLEFIDKLRPMQRFESPGELIATVMDNIAWVRENL
ncbi:MAG: hypothetical protein LBP91_01520 [Coriobacteriales bacterium]|jgi:riboflavin kinase/FMN adenylyltransferase|nr:hypothetical protein [Coriobacteriales bacterium]